MSGGSKQRNSLPQSQRPFAQRMAKSGMAAYSTRSVLSRKRWTFGTKRSYPEQGCGQMRTRGGLRAFLSGFPVEIRNGGHHPQGKPPFWGQIWGSFRKLPEPQNTPQKAGGIPVSGQGKHSVRLYTVRRSRANPAFPQPLKGGERQNTSWEKGQKAPPISEQDKGGMLPEAANRRKTPSGRAGRQVKDVC